MDRYLQEGEALWRAGRAADEAANPAFYAMMRRRFAEAAKRLGMEYPRSPTPTDEREAATSSSGT